jgi:hypothetical protein
MMIATFRSVCTPRWWHSSDVLYAAVIVLHAAAGLIALLVGALAAVRGSRFGLYFWSLVACIGLLIPAVALDWEDLDTATRIIFPALIVLGLYMIWRAMRARRLLAADGASSDVYFEDVAFTLIALFVAFVAIVVLDLGSPGWLIAVVTVAAVLVGRRAVDQIRPGDATAQC